MVKENCYRKLSKSATNISSLFLIKKLRFFTTKAEILVVDDQALFENEN